MVLLPTLIKCSLMDSFVWFGFWYSISFKVIENCSETALKLLWIYFELVQNLIRSEIALKLSLAHLNFTLKLLWICSFRNNFEVGSHLLKNCSETALNLLWIHFELDQKWFWSWSSSTLELLWNCSEFARSEIILKLVLICSRIALKLLWICFEFTLNSIRNDFEVGPHLL